MYPKKKKKKNPSRIDINQLKKWEGKLEELGQKLI
jgi:hypothetical protein